MNSNTTRTTITIETEDGKGFISTETTGGHHSMSAWPYSDIMEEAERRAAKYRAQGHIVEIRDERQAVQS